MISHHNTLIVIRPEDLTSDTYEQIDQYLQVVLDDLDVEMPVEQPKLLVIRPEDLPGIPYTGSVPQDLIRIDHIPDDLPTLERQMLHLINADRAAHPEESEEAAPLLWDEAVAAVARSHSEDMIERAYMEHTNLDGLEPSERLQNQGIYYTICGENIAGSPTMYIWNHQDYTIQMYTGYPTIEQAEEGLMHSPGHRKNILRAAFTHVGVGIARNTDGTLVITQNFIAR